MRTSIRASGTFHFPREQAEDMSAPEAFAKLNQTLDDRAPMVWTPPSRRGLRSAVNRTEGEVSCRSLALVWIWRNMSSRFTASTLMEGRCYARRFVVMRMWPLEPAWSCRELAAIVADIGD